jgi:pyruvate,water dikinase
MSQYTLDFSEIDMSMIPVVGGKNASLGEMFRNLSGTGVKVPDGFAVKAQAYWDLLDAAGMRLELAAILDALDNKDFKNLAEVGAKARKLLLECSLTGSVAGDILAAYRSLRARADKAALSVAVRSSATAEDLPNASFAGQLESYLNVSGDKALLEACRKCYASLFTDRAIQYRVLNGFQHMETAVSVGVQAMVRSDLACAGVGFTLEPESGFREVVVITGSWGLGENVVQGAVTPDQFTVFKPSLLAGKRAILSRKAGAKEQTMVYAENPAPGEPVIRNIETPVGKKRQFVLSDAEVENLARWALSIEAHYRRPMDIEWAKDGESGELFIVQARPETVHASGKKDSGSGVLKQYQLIGKGKALVKGLGLGGKIAAGRARILLSPREADALQPGEVLVTSITNPDWDPILKRAAAIVTDKGGRTSHAAIVAREMGVAAIVGAGNATTSIRDGEEVTVCCAEGETGTVYAGRLDWKETEIDLAGFSMPKTKPMLILGDPDRAFSLAALPNQGVGLMRLEFVIANAIRVHPAALARWAELEEGPQKEEIRGLVRGYPSPEEYFVEKLSEAVGTIAAAFHPKDVIVRMSDFKSNEYANLLGGRQFEPHEENPMLGFRGASRYYHPRYRDGFRLECLAMKKVREEMGLQNVKLMIPFCRTPEEGQKVLAEMALHGLRRGENGLQVYVMIEIPSNVLQAEAFAGLFDGFSIGSNDLTQLTLGLDRDSALVSHLFSEKNPSVQELISRAIDTARNSSIPVGLCGQAPSDFPEFARFLVECGIQSISFNPDALLRGIENIHAAEAAAGEILYGRKPMHESEYVFAGPRQETTPHPGA